MDTFLDIPYGPLDEHRFDLYIPLENKRNDGLVVFVHGGAWRS